MMVNKRVREIVRFVRLELYNRGLTCGAGAVRRRLKEVYDLKPLPSVRTIGHILAAEGLTHGRTGWYEGEESCWVPAAAKLPQR